MSAGGDRETLATADALAQELDDSDLSELAKITRGVSLKARDYVVNNARRHFIKQKWLKFFENKKAKIYYHYACHTMNVLNFKHTESYLKQFDGEMWLSMVEKPLYLNLKYLPDNTKKWIEKFVENDSIISHLWSDKFNDTYCKEFLKYIYFLEEHRGPIPQEIDTLFINLAREL